MRQLRGKCCEGTTSRCLSCRTMCRYSGRRNNPVFGEIRMARQLLNQTNCMSLSVPVAEISYILLLNKKSCCMILSGTPAGCGRCGIRLSYRRRLCRCASDAETDECGRRDECHLPPCFDMCSNPKEALEQIIGLGIDRVLTSGQEATAEKGIPLLKNWWNRPTDGSSSCRDAV